MKVILKQDVKHLGLKDDVVTVKNGYGSNYLLPKGFAVIASESNLKVLGENQKQRAFKEEKIRQAAQKTADFLKEITVKVGAKAGESGKIFGSVTTVQLSDAIKKLGHEIDRRLIQIDEEAIKTLGSYTAKARLHRDVIAEIKFEVVAE
jgi:large subunit ribosomal protein L9